ncbi:MAG: hypothetical protein LQ338_008024, partial [Usnochroma carphineum]
RKKPRGATKTSTTGVKVDNSLCPKLNTLAIRTSSLSDLNGRAITGSPIQIPFVPPYVPSTGLANGFLDEPSASVNHARKHRNGTVRSRFTTQDGLIRFIVRSESGARGKGTDSNDIDVSLADIYEYVSPEELERYENLDWEQEDERERFRPKLGRPRKQLSQPDQVTSHPSKTKKPRGRPRKQSTISVGPLGERKGASGKSKTSGGGTFLAIHIPSPIKEDQPMPDASPSTLPVTLRPSPSESLEREPTPSTDDLSMSNSRASATQVDQLTPSNANRVVGVKVPGPSPSQRAHRPPYAMVQTALGDSGSSDRDDVVPNSGSEDELTMLRTTKPRRFSSGAVIPSSSPEDGEQDESRFLPARESVDDPSGGPDEDGLTDMPLRDDHSLSGDSMLSSGAVDRNPGDPQELLQQFQASNTRHILSKSSDSSSSNEPQAKTVHRYFQPKGSVKGSKLSSESEQPRVSLPDRPESSVYSRQVARAANSSSSRQREASLLSSTSRQQQNPTLSTHREVYMSQSKEPASSSSRQTTLDFFPSGRSKHSQHQTPAPTSPEPNPNPTRDSYATTPDSSRHMLQSMTPHFPSSGKREKPNLPRLRGGSKDPTVAKGSPTELPRHHHRAIGPTAKPTTLNDREGINPLLSPRTDDEPPVTTDGDIELGSPMITSDEGLDQPITAHSRPSPSDVVLGSPVTTSSSSEGRSKPRTAQSSREPRVPSDAHHGKKRRRSSERRSGSEASWYYMVRG